MQVTKLALVLCFIFLPNITFLYNLDFLHTALKNIRVFSLMCPFQSDQSAIDFTSDIYESWQLRADRKANFCGLVIDFI